MNSGYKKCMFSDTWINSNDILMDSSKIEAIRNLKTAKPLTLMTQKNQKYEWAKEQEEAFQTLKDNLGNAPILGKVENATAEMLHGLDQLMERKEGGVDRLTKSAYFLAIREDYKMEKLARLYIDEIVAGQGVPASITSDRDGRFTSRLNTARDRQKSYADNRRKLLEVKVEDQVLLKVSPWKGKYLVEANLHAHLEEIKVDKTLCFVEEPVEIIDRELSLELLSKAGYIGLLADFSAPLNVLMWFG
ncbi:hypothetical protein Tco_0583593 [Tanacetum coccineum]